MLKIQTKYDLASNFKYFLYIFNEADGGKMGNMAEIEKEEGPGNGVILRDREVPLFTISVSKCHEIHSASMHC